MYDIPFCDLIVNIAKIALERTLSNVWAPPDLCDDIVKLLDH